MWIWNVKLEVEWSYNKGFWDDEREFNVSSTTAEKAVEKAKRVCAKYTRPWKDKEELCFVTGVRLSGLERGEEIDA